MGVVIKQSFWASVFAYIGVVIGYLNTLYLRPKYFDLEQIGLLNLIISNALMLAPLASFGMPGSLVKYYPFVDKTENSRRAFLGFQLALILTTCFSLYVGIIIFLEPIKSLFAKESGIYNDYIILSIIVMVSQALFMYLQSYSRVVLDIIVPGILKDVYLRLGYALLVLGYGLEYISFDMAVYSLIGIYASMSMITGLHVVFNQNFRIFLPTWTLFTSQFKKIWDYNFYTLLNAGASSIYGNISFFLIPVLLGLDQNGIFTTCFYMSIIIELPKRALLLITAPIVSREFKNRNFEEVGRLYSRSSLSLGLIGMLLFIGIITNINDLFDIIPKGSDFRQGFYVVLFIGLAKVIDMFFNLTNNILSYSEHYRKNVHYLVISALILVIISYLLIPLMGITGAALAFLISTIVLNTLKYTFIKKALNLTPISIKHLYLLIISAILLGVFYFISIVSNPIIDIMVKSALISVIFIFLAFRLNISEDINNLIRSIFKKYLNINI